MEFPYFVMYLCTKALAYAGWCYLGLRFFAPGKPKLVMASIKYGCARLMLGVLLGVVIFLAALSMNNAIRNAPLTYLVIYVPVRIFEWGLFYSLMRRQPISWHGLFWVVGGVVVSCLADLPIAISEGGVVPVGRPFC